MQNTYSNEQLLSATISNIDYKTKEIQKAMDSGNYDLARELRKERNFDLDNALRLIEGLKNKNTINNENARTM